MIEKLRSKTKESSESYIVTGIIPGHMANPPRMNWHIEKDGIYIAKGNGILKFAHIDSYYRYENYMEDMKKYKSMDIEEYKKDFISEYMRRYNSDEESAARQADNHIESMEKDKKLMDQFESFINKIDTTCGGMISLLGTVAHATGLVDDTINAENLYSKYPLSNYQLDFYVDNSWSWLPWNWLDGIGKSVQYGLCLLYTSRCV